ncbi:hypothetical protein AC578_5980, partial [Pseudocercospora eumusae]
MGCDQLHVPTHLTKHIDYITSRVKMSAILKKRDFSKGEGWEGHSHIQPPTWHYPMPPAASGLHPELASITPPCWRALDGLPVGHVNDSVNTIGLHVYEQGDYFSSSSHISKYLAMFSPN